MKGIFTLSWRNFVAYKKIYIKIIVALVALLFLITLFCSFTVSLKNKQNFYLYQNISSNYVYGERPLQSGEIKERFDILEVKRVINEQFNVAVFGEDYDRWYTPSQWFVVDYDDERHFFDDGMLDFEPYVAKNGVVTPNDLKEANGAELMIGELPQKADEIVLSEQWLAFYGLTRDVIGKSITLRAVKFVGEDGEYAPEYIVPIYPSRWKYEVLPFKAEFTVCGILTNEYSALGGRSYVFSPNVLITEDNVLAAYGLQTKYVCSLDEWASSDTVKYFDDNDIVYCGENSVKMTDLTVKMRLVSDRLALYFGSALIFAVVFTLIMFIGRLCAAQMKNSGELLISGLTNKQLFCTWIVQFAISALIALIAAIGLTVGALYAINAVLYNGLAITLTVSISDFAVITAVGLVIVAVVSISALTYIALRFRCKQTRELLDT